MEKSRWLLLAHQIPSEPSNRRVKVWRKLQILGAVPIKNSIYVLPNLPVTREDFAWLRKEILQMKGDASVFLANSIADMDDRDIVNAFQDARAKDFARFIEQARAVVESMESALSGGHVRGEALARLEKAWANVKAEWESLTKIDFFKAPNRTQAERLMVVGQKLLLQAESLCTKDAPELPEPVDAKRLRGSIWVTRASPHIDRIACAWLIRRFVDPKAHFKFVTEPYKLKNKSEVRFDMAEGEFTHFGDWCSFETFLHRLNFKDPALQELAEIIHDIDLKDKKFARLEANGVSQVIRGLCRIHEKDMERIDTGTPVFDALYTALQHKP